MTGTERGGQIRIIAFINEAMAVREFLAYLVEPCAAPRIAPARGPSLRDLLAAGAGGGNPHGELAPAYEFDQRVA